VTFPQQSSYIDYHVDFSVERGIFDTLAVDGSFAAAPVPDSIPSRQRYERPLFNARTVRLRAFFYPALK
jgi:hypothetical protein